MSSSSRFSSSFPSSMSPSSPSISQDRILYTLLVIIIGREALESLHIMALWIWLELNGFANVIKNISTLPWPLVNKVADEALICLNCMIDTNNDARNSLPSASSFESSTDIPITRIIVKRNISLNFFHENRSTSQEVTKIANEVCLRAFSDIMHIALQRDINVAVQRNTSTVMRPGGGMNCGMFANNFGWVHPDERTIFVTFSRGCPVFELEIKGYFSRLYEANCVECVQMDESNGCPMYARIIFRRALFVYRVLNGKEIVKFTINGKHVWARKFVPRHLRSAQPLPLPTLSSLPPS